MRRIFPLILSFALLFSLCGCGRKAAERQFTHNTLRPTETLPHQEEMPQQQLEEALARLEYAAICSAIDLDQRTDALQGYVPFEKKALIHDYDGDGKPELIYGPNALLFDADAATLSYRFSQSGILYYQDKESTLYLKEDMGGSYTFEQDGMMIDGGGSDTWYSVYDGADWIHAFAHYSSWEKEIICDEEGMFVSYGKVLSESESAKIGQQEVSVAELESHLSGLGLTEVATEARDLTRLTFDAIYTDSLLSALEAQLGALSIRADIDSDGQAETLLFPQDLVAKWQSRLTYNAELESYEGALYYFSEALDPALSRTCVLIADQRGDELVIEALCAGGQLQVYDGMPVRRSAGFLWLDEQPVYLSGGMDSTDIGMLTKYLESFGYSDCMLKVVDISDLEGPEYLCLCQKGGVWYLLVFILESGDPKPLYYQDLSNTAVYLVEQDGRQCLLTYSQRITTNWEGRSFTNYSYDLLRINAEGWAQSLDYSAISYSDADTDAAPVAAFFEKLNVYLVKIILLRDPYRLQGRMWAAPEQVDYGTIPQEPAEEEAAEPQDATLGFVAINDPGSWLHLRVGPGTEYDRVLVDPNDPESFVRQAQGSPVTVLETIETGDAANPVWVKIRISYADREIVGYSSKTYIHIP